VSKRRCDGCGRRSSGLSVYRNDEGQITARYCPGCNSLRRARDIEPGDHDQHKLCEQR